MGVVCVPEALQEKLEPMHNYSVCDSQTIGLFSVISLLSRILMSSNDDMQLTENTRRKPSVFGGIRNIGPNVSGLAVSIISSIHFSSSTTTSFLNQSSTVGPTDTSNVPVTNRNIRVDFPEVGPEV